MDLKEAFKIRPTDKDETSYMITIGNHLATEETFPTKEAAQERIDSVDWNLIAAMIYACHEADEFAKKQNKEE